MLSVTFVREPSLSLSDRYYSTKPTSDASDVIDQSSKSRLFLKTTTIQSLLMTQV